MSLLLFTKHVRSFLEPHWITALKSWGDPIPQPPSKQMCRFSCLFLKDVLKESNYGEWLIMLGRPDLVKSATTVDYGFKTKNDCWHDHAWLVKDNLLIDITADQFDGDAVYVGRIDSNHYRPNLTEHDALHHLSTLKKRVNKWLDAWRECSSNKMYCGKLQIESCYTDLFTKDETEKY